MILFCGLPGVGKTTPAKELAYLIDAVVLSTDKIRKELISKPTYTIEEKALIYSVMLVVAKYLYSAGVNCILDATFNTEKFRKEAIDRIGITPAHLHIVECVCLEDVVIARLQSRKRGYSDADVSVYMNMKQVYEPVKEDHIIADTSRSPAIVAKEVKFKILKRHEPKAT
jgi:predicted kinase